MYSTTLRLSSETPDQFFARFKETFSTANATTKRNRSDRLEQAANQPSSSAQPRDRLNVDSNKPKLTREQKRSMLKDERRSLQNLIANVKNDETDEQQRKEISEQKKKVKDQEITIDALVEMFEDRRVKNAVMRLVNSEIEGIQLKKSLTEIREETKNTVSYQQALEENEHLKDLNKEFFELAMKYRMEKEKVEEEMKKLKSSLESAKRGMVTMAERRQEIQEKASEVAERDFGKKIEEMSALQYREYLEDQKNEIFKILDASLVSTSNS